MSDKGKNSAGSLPPRPRPPPNRRRDKPQLSCHLCRRRKLKCDRNEPCGNCIKRGLEAQCAFASNHGQSTELERRSISSTPVKVHQRLRQLEEQVVSMLHDRTGQDQRHDPPLLPTPNSSIASIDDTASTAGGEYEETPAESAFPDCSSWASILCELRKNNRTIDCSQKFRVNQNPSRPSTRGPLLLYGCTPAASLQELLGAIPPRSIANRMISTYFNGLDLASAIVHGPEFMNEYENFWKAPEQTSPIWLSLLYSMLCTSIQFQRANPESSVLPPEALDPYFDRYREKVIQCLVFGRYTSGGPYVVQAMMHYIAIEIFDQRDAEDGLWILSGILINLASRMGYNRDPDQVPNLSPYESEMRRRWWRSIISLDNTISEAAGAPRMLRDTDNVPEPRNLLDSDFDSSTTILPPSRPDNEPTPMLYCLAKTRALKAFGMVTDILHDRRPHNYGEISRIDACVIKAHSELPRCYRWRPMAQSLTDPPHIICRRLNLEIVYLKVRVVLHLKYVMPTKDQGKYAHSRSAVLENVSKLLELHHVCDEETQSSGQLFPARWRYLAAAHQHFLLASIAACFYLEHNKSSMDIQELKNFVRLCRKSQGIWIRASRSSTEAAKAAEALRICLDKVDSPDLVRSETLQQEDDLTEEGTATDNGVNSYLPGPIVEIPDSLLIPPIAGQSSDYLLTGDWNTTQSG